MVAGTQRVGVVALKAGALGILVPLFLLFLRLDNDGPLLVLWPSSILMLAAGENPLGYAIFVLSIALNGMLYAGVAAAFRKLTSW